MLVQAKLCSFGLQSLQHHRPSSQGFSTHKLNLTNGSNQLESIDQQRWVLRARPASLQAPALSAALSELFSSAAIRTFFYLIQTCPELRRFIELSFHWKWLYSISRNLVEILDEWLRRIQKCFVSTPHDIVWQDCLKQRTDCVCLTVLGLTGCY